VVLIPAVLLLLYLAVSSAVEFAQESAWYDSNVELDFQLIVDADIYDGIPQPCDNEEIAALAEEFVALGTSNELQDFLNTVPREAFPDIQRHIDAKIIASIIEQTQLPVHSPLYEYLHEQSRIMKERSALLTVIYGLNDGSIALTFDYHRNDRGSYVRAGMTVASQNHQVFIHHGRFEVTLEIRNQVLAILHDMPERQAERFEDLFADFMREIWTLEDYHRAFRLSSVLIQDISDNSIIGGSWIVRTWPSSTTNLAVDAFNAVTRESTNFEFDELLKNPMAARVTHDALDVFVLIDIQRQFDIYFSQRFNQER